MPPLSVESTAPTMALWAASLDRCRLALSTPVRTTEAETTCIVVLNLVGATEGCPEG